MFGASSLFHLEIHAPILPHPPHTNLDMYDGSETKTTGSTTHRDRYKADSCL